VAAAEQFRQVEASRLKTSTQPQFESELSLVKENCQYYEAYCALSLGNDDAESMFQRFIKEHPENPLTKLAYFQIGKSYFKQGKYQDALRWFDKVQAVELNGHDNTEYKFRKGYAYFATNDFKNAQLLFAEVKNKRSEFTEDATYYFAYIAYLNKDYHLALANFERLKNSKKYENKNFFAGGDSSPSNQLSIDAQPDHHGQGYLRRGWKRPGGCTCDVEGYRHSHRYRWSGELFNYSY